MNEIKRGLVSPYDLVSSASNHWGNIINPYSKDGEYSKDPVLDFFFHGVDKWKIFEFDSEGNIVQGEVNCKNLLKMMQSDPANLNKYLFLYGKIKGLPTDFPDSKNLLNKFCEELKEENITLVSSLLPESISNVLSSVINNQSKYNTLTKAMSKGLPDPIAIDMDGDGIETIGKDESSAYFDLDKNGFAEKTGWIKGDDAILARDINGDGVINDGSELFGDQTLKADGTKAA